MESDRKQRALGELARLQRTADAWEGERAHQRHLQELDTRFQDASPNDLLKMWASATNERGKRLNKFEAEALVAAFVRVFGEFPPTGTSASDISEQPPPLNNAKDTIRSLAEEDFAIIRRKSAAELLGVSLATIDRMEKDGRLPAKTRLGRAIAGWRRRELEAAIDQGTHKRKN